MKETWLRRLGTASAFTPKAGMVHECKTSAAVINIRIWALIGRMVRLSTSKRRNVSIVISSVGII